MVRYRCRPVHHGRLELSERRPELLNPRRQLDRFGPGTQGNHPALLCIKRLRRAVDHEHGALSENSPQRPAVQAHHCACLNHGGKSTNLSECRTMRRRFPEGIAGVAILVGAGLFRLGVPFRNAIADGPNSQLEEHTRSCRTNVPAPNMRARQISLPFHPWARRPQTAVSDRGG
jgi:hypothetical protein